MLSWAGRGVGKSVGKYALMVSDTAAIAAVRAKLKAAAPSTVVHTTKTDGATRAWMHGSVWVLLLLPLLIIAAILLFSKDIAGWAAGRMSIETERALAEKIWALQKPTMQLVQRPAANKMLDEIGAKLTAGSPYKYQFHLVENKTVNAFAMPGGYVVVHTGLIERASGAEELAGVLAHEVQHVEKRHSLKAMAHSLGLGVATSILLGDASGSVIGIAQELSRLSFSRESEAEADTDGLKALARADINPQGLKTFFKKMAEEDAKDKLGLPAILSSHPASADRFAAIDAQLPAVTKGKTFTPLPYKWDEIKAALK